MSNLLSTIATIAVPLEIPGDPPKFIGTAFLISYPGFEGDLSPSIIVTCKHVVKDCQNVQFRWNVDNEITRFVIGTQVGSFKCDWVFHPDEDIDLAIALVPSPGIKDEEQIRWYHVKELDEVTEEDLGQDVFYLGFPLGAGADIEIPHKALVRKAMISSVPEKKDYIIEANAFPGTSGSPVFLLRDEVYKLIGVIASYIPYRDIAVSVQTGKPRIIFEENSGLSYVIKSKYILETIETDEFQKQSSPIVEYARKAINSQKNSG